MVGTWRSGAGPFAAFAVGCALAACGGATRSGTGDENGGNTGSGGVPDGGSSGSGAASASGGTSATSLSVEDFDRKCTYDGDCVLVEEGEQCGCPGCETRAAIQKSEVDRWSDARNRFTCEALPCVPNACEEIVPACDTGKCVARATQYVDPTKYDSACQVDADCRLIRAGEFCQPCPCSNAAVSNAGYAQYEKDGFDVDRCSPGPATCDCVEPTRAICERPQSSAKGTCVPSF